jgi:hypothetical protein
MKTVGDIFTGWKTVSRPEAFLFELFEIREIVIQP